MSQMASEIASLNINLDCQADLKDKSLKSEKGGRNFFTLIQELMNPEQKEYFHRPNRHPRTAAPPENDCHLYLESLRKGLLAKGKSLDEISLSTNDLPLLEKFLYQCGFAREKVESFLKDLLENNPQGEINFSEIFLKMSQLVLPERKIFQPVILEASAIPSVESTLKSFGLTTNEVDHIINAARPEGGGLDLNKFILKLKGINNEKIPLQNRLKLDEFIHALEMTNRLAESNQNLNLEPSTTSPIESAMKGFRLTANEVKRALTGVRNVNKVSGGELGSGEQITAGSGNQNQLAIDLKSTIEQILERVVVNEQKDRSVSPLLSFSKLRLSNPYSEGKTAKEFKTSKKKNPSSFVKEENVINAKSTDQKPDSSSLVRKIGISTDLDDGWGLNRVAKQGEYGEKLETRKINPPYDINTHTLSESINTLKQNSKAVRDSLPAYLIDHASKQIAKSILRGERSFKFQLKPPELGVVKVEMGIKDNVLTLGMTTENGSVKKLLLSHIHELREAFLQNGVKFDKIDININYNFDNSLANSKQGLKEQQTWIQNLNGAPFLSENDSDDSISLPRYIATGEHLLDLVT